MEKTKLKKNKNTKENEEFWKHAEKASEKVKKWPEWKRNIKLTNY
jgi:hypothetical protein